MSATSPPSRLLRIAVLVLVAGCGLPIATAPLVAQATLELTDEATMPAATVEAQLLLASNPAATALQVDLLFDSTKLTAGAPVAASGLTNHVLASAEPQAGLVRLVIYSPINAALPVGEIARVPFTASGGATPGLTPLDPSAAEVATAGAINVLPLSLVSGSVHIFNLQAELGVRLTAATHLVANGDPLSYSLVASNAGPDAVTSVDLTDLAPAKLAAVTWSCSAVGGASCSAGGTDDILDTIDLPVGSSATYTLAGTVSTGSSFIDNLADLQAPAEVFDPDTADNSDSVTVDVCTTDDVVLTNWNIGTVEVFNACVTLTAGPDFNVLAGGDVTLRSLGSVSLNSDFSVEAGGKLTIEVP